MNQVVMKAVGHDPSAESIHLGHGEPVDGNLGFKICTSTVLSLGATNAATYIVIG